MGYILLREAYIANAKTIQVEPQVILTSTTVSFKFTYKAGSDVEELPLPHAHTYAHTHARTYTCTYTHMHTRTRAPMLMRLVSLKSYGTQNCSLIARPLFSFQYILQETKYSLRAGLQQLFIKLKVAKSRELFWCSVAKSHKLRILILNC